jgi:hypothetical protein
MKTKTSLCGLMSGLLLLGAGTLTTNAAFTVDQGTIVGIDGNTRQLREYSFSGSLMDTLTISGLPSTPIGVAILGNRVFVGDVVGNVGEVNLVSGSVFNLFNGGGNEAIGDNGANLLTYNYGTGVTREYSTGGVLLNTIPLAAGNGGTGLDAFGSRIFVGLYNGSGDIREYNTSGTLVNTVTTGLPANSVSGLGYDNNNGTFWLSSGFGDDRIRQFSSTGTLLATFSSGSDWINGLDVVSAVPEPSTYLAGAILLLPFGAQAVRRLRTRKEAV